MAKGGGLKKDIKPTKVVFMDLNFHDVTAGKHYTGTPLPWYIPAG